MGNKRIVWLSSVPAHYMSELHLRLESQFSNISFVYSPLEVRGVEFSHEQLHLPKNSTVLESSKSFLQAWNELKSLDPDVVIISGNYPRVNLVAAFWAKMHKRSLCYLSDSNVLDIKNIKKSWLGKFALKILMLSTAKLLFIGMRNKEFYISICGSDAALKRLHRFPLPHLCDPFENSVGSTDRKFTFLILGRLVDVKAVDRVLYAFSQLERDVVERSQLLIAGDGPLKKYLENLSARLGINQSVIFLGSIPSNKAANIFSRAHVVLVTSHQEPWGLVINEAFSSSKPVIVPHWVGARPDLVRNLETGIVIADNSPESIAKAMQFSFHNQNLMRQMGLSGRKLIREGGWNIYGAIDSISLLINDFKLGDN